MVLERHRNAGFLGMRKTGANRLDHPSKCVFVCVARQRRFVSLHFHQIVEGFDGFPSTVIQTNCRDTKLGSDVDAFLCMRDMCAPLCHVGMDEILMDGKHWKRESVLEG